MADLRLSDPFPIWPASFEHFSASAETVGTPLARPLGSRLGASWLAPAPLGLGTFVAPRALELSRLGGLVLVRKILAGSSIRVYLRVFVQSPAGRTLDAKTSITPYLCSTRMRLAVHIHGYTRHKLYLHRPRTLGYPPSGLQ